MRLGLVLLQFPFLYCIGVFLGLEVYGSDFDSVAGYLYLVPLLAILFFHYLYRAIFKMIPKIILYPVFYAGAVLGTVAYRRLHVGFWDEHSVVQAALICGLGMFSLLATAWAENLRENEAGLKPLHLAFSLVSLGIVYLAGWWFPMLPFFGIVIILALAPSAVRLSGWGLPEHPGPLVYTATLRSPGLAPALLFWLGAELSRIIVDYNMDTSWSLSLAVLFMAAALGALLSRAGLPLLRTTPLAIGLLSSLSAAFWPSLVIHPAHSAFLGLALGCVIASIVYRKPGTSRMLVMSLVLTLGMVLSSAYTTQMASLPEGSLIFLAPALAAFVWKFIRRRKGRR